jgi:outer membrane protein assembly factor BamB
MDLRRRHQLGNSRTLAGSARAHRKHIGIAGTVVALDRSTGSEVWWSDLDGDFVYGALQDGDLYATANGELFCLDPATGDIRWQNPLKGLGRGYITIAASGSQQAIVMRDKKRRDDEAAAASSGT